MKIRRSQWNQYKLIIVVLSVVIVTGIFREMGFIPYILSSGLTAGAISWILNKIEESEFLELIG